MFQNSFVVPSTQMLVKIYNRQSWIALTDLNQINNQRAKLCILFVFQGVIGFMLDLKKRWVTDLLDFQSWYVVYVDH